MFASHPAPKCRQAVGTWWDVVGMSCCVPLLLSGQGWLLAIASSRPFRPPGRQSDQRPAHGARQDEGSGGAVSAQARLLWGGFSFTKLLCFYQNGFLTVIAFFFFLRENIIFNYISLGFH